MTITTHPERIKTMTDYTAQRGDLSREQVQQLLKAIHPSRVITGAHVKPHLSQQDVLAHLTRIFGFGHFDVEVLEASVIYDEPTVNAKGKDAREVAYRALVRLWVRNDRQELVCYFDGGSTGVSEGQPSRADSHDLAYKSALSTATKRAAIALGDQFGLSLYNKGQMEPLVRGTLVGGPTTDDVQQGITQQEEDGGAVAERQDADAEAPQEQPAAPRRKVAAKGTQGTRRAAPKPAEEPAEEEPTSDGPAAALGDQPAPTEVLAEVHAQAHADTQAAAEGAPAVAPDANPGETEPQYQWRKQEERRRAEAEERSIREQEAAEQERQAREREEPPLAANPQTGEIIDQEPPAEEDREPEPQQVTTEAQQRLTPEQATEAVRAEPEPWAQLKPYPETDDDPDWFDWIDQEGQTLDTLRDGWKRLQSSGWMNHVRGQRIIARKTALEAQAKAAGA